MEENQEGEHIYLYMRKTAVSTPYLKGVLNVQSLFNNETPLEFLVQKVHYIIEQFIHYCITIIVMMFLILLS